MFKPNYTDTYSELFRKELPRFLNKIFQLKFEHFFREIQGNIFK